MNEHGAEPARPDAVRIRVELPTPLRTLARIQGPVEVEVEGPPTTSGVLDAIEARFPALLGTVRDQRTGRRRDFIRFFACNRDLSHESPDTPLPAAVAEGREPLLVVGAMAGG